MAIDKERYSIFLEKVAQDMDILPTKHQQAVDRYQAVGKWLEGGVYPGCESELSIYPQGSFRLGTVVRPIIGGIEADYDIDLVCELPVPKSWTEPCLVKTMVGDRLREHQRYRRMLDTEGKRCWTLEYREQDGVGFHLDVLPAVPDHRRIDDTSIAITDKQEARYHWSASDPRGYARWFDEKNRGAFMRVMMEQKRSILNHNLSAYLSVDDVPDQLVRTPLQRTIQIMKRHRDLYGAKVTNGYRPISMIITTLAALFYRSQHDVYTTLIDIVSQLHAHAVLIDNRSVAPIYDRVNPIQRTEDGHWYIGNPVNPEENFADRWHEDNHARAKAFFSWVAALKRDLVDLLAASRVEDARRTLIGALGQGVSSHVGLITSSESPLVKPRRTHISTRPAKPWNRQ